MYQLAGFSVIVIYKQQQLNLNSVRLSSEKSKAKVSFLNVYPSSLIYPALQTRKGIKDNFLPSANFSCANAGSQHIFSKIYISTSCAHYRFLINQCQIITFFILKSDDIEKFKNRI